MMAAAAGSVRGGRRSSGAAAAVSRCDPVFRIAALSPAGDGRVPSPAV